MTLRRRLVERIRADGPLTFAAFMEAALYDPADGFFSAAPVGREFVTSAHVSPLFSMLLAAQIRETGAATIVDLGAGDGTLARGLRAALPDASIVCIERSAGARELLAGARFPVAAAVEEVGSIEGCIVANELFDNVPFHLLRRRAGVVTEVFIDARGDHLEELESAPTIEVPPMRDGEERPVSPQAAALIADVVRALRRGYIFVFDYGFVAGEDPEPVRGYRAHRRVADLIGEPGSSDITGPVDFDALAAAARSAGAQVWGPVSQRAALESLGYRAMLDALREQQRGDEAAGDWRSAISSFSARGEAAMLLDPSGLGGLKVLAIGSEGMREPRLVGPVT